jgi:hypothetical protein
VSVKERMEWFELLLDWLIISSVEVEQFYCTIRLKIRSIGDTLQLNRLLQWLPFQVQPLLNDWNDDDSPIERLRQLRFRVSTLSPLLQRWSRVATVWPQITGRLQNKWRQTPLYRPLLLSRVLLDQLGHATIVAQRLSTHRWSTVRLAVARTRVRLMRQLRYRLTRMQQPHAQQLPVFVIGSFLICNCFASGQNLIAIALFALLHILMQLLEQNPLNRMFSQMLKHHQPCNNLWRDLQQLLVATDFPFSIVQNDVKWLNHCLTLLWPTFLMPVSCATILL